MSFFPSWRNLKKKTDPPPGDFPPPITRIRLPAGFLAGKGVSSQYALYVAVKLGASIELITGIPVTPECGSRKHEQVINAKAADMIAACRKQGISCELIPGKTDPEYLFQGSTGELSVFPGGPLNRIDDGYLSNHVSKTATPILLCPDHYLDIESIALAYDGSLHAAKMLDFAARISERAVWPLSVLMVSNGQEDSICRLDDVEASLESYAIDSTTIMLSGRVDKALYRFMHEESVELLIMSPFSQGPATCSRIGTSVASLISQGGFPLLLLP